MKTTTVLINHTSSKFQTINLPNISCGGSMRTTFSILIFTAVIVLLFSAGTAAAGGGKWSVKGTYVEGCSCTGVCGCELTGLESGCQGVGAMVLDGGSWSGTDLTGAKIAYAMVPGEWVRLYVDAKDDAQREAATEFGKNAFKDFGKLDKVSTAKVNLTGTGGKYSMNVDDGNIMSLSTEPVLGGDNKTPITHTNVKNPLNSVFLQGKTIAAKYTDGDKTFELKGTNSYSNPHMKGSGSVK
jgi:hypothetical protein